MTRLARIVFERVECGRSACWQNRVKPGWGTSRGCFWYGGERISRRAAHNRRNHEEVFAGASLVGEVADGQAVLESLCARVWAVENDAPPGTPIDDAVANAQ